MKITFHGAARTVTGSKHLISLNNGKKILLDCGMFQGMGKDTDDLNKDFGFDPESVDYVILSHAHIDHSGLLPKLVKDGYAGRIYATPATKDLASVMLEDSAGIQENDVKYVNKKRALEGLPYVEPLYSTEDAMEAIDRFVVVEYDKWHTIEEGIEFCYTDAGHIIGSACVHLRIKEKGERLAEKYNTKGIFPLTLLLNPNGEVIAQWEGLPDMNAEEFSNNIQSAINAKK